MTDVFKHVLTIFLFQNKNYQFVIPLCTDLFFFNNIVCEFLIDMFKLILMLSLFQNNNLPLLFLAGKFGID